MRGTPRLAEGDPYYLTCPCCNGLTRLEESKRGVLSLSIVRLTKPEGKQVETPGSRPVVLSAIEAVCKANGVSLTDIQGPARDRTISAIRKAVIKAARDAGASTALICELVNRSRRVVCDIAPPVGEALGRRSV